MIQLPYRDIDTMGSGGDSPTVAKVSRKRKPWVYRSQYDRIVYERDLWKKGFIASMWVIAAMLFAQIFGSVIIDLILSA